MAKIKDIIQRVLELVSGIFNDCHKKWHLKILHPPHFIIAQYKGVESSASTFFEAV